MTIPEKKSDGQVAKKESFVMYNSFHKPLQKLSDADKGQLLEAIFQYQINGELIDLSPAAEMAFDFIREVLDRDNEKYLKVCHKNKENIKKRWNKNDTTVLDPIRPDTKNTDNDNDNDNENDIKRKIYKKKFQIPGIEEIREYCQERGNSIDPEQFFDFYEAKGWKIGKESMKDWKAAVRTWEKNRDSSPPPATRNNSGLDEIAARKAASDKAYEEACAR